MGNEVELLKALAALREKESGCYAEKFKPYSAQLEFLNSKNSIVCLLGGNRSGKSEVGSYAIMCHATGNYPDWWNGVRYAGPVSIWVAGVTATRVRDTIQLKLFGRLGKLGTGMIPKDKIVAESIIKKPGTPMAFDQLDIKHASGGLSNIQFFSYEMESEKFMGSSVNIIWFDEEPPEAIYNECKMRILDCSGNIFFTFTPLGGMTPLYDNIMADDQIHKIFLSMDEAKHLKAADIERLLDGMSDAEKKARRYGVATIGEGKVFNFQENEYSTEPFEVPLWWRRIGALDVGLTHPTGALMGVIDDDSKTVYITNEYRVKDKTAIDHAAHLKHWGIKFMTDPAAFHRQIGTGTSTASIYEDEGLELIRANNDVEASIAEIRKLIGSGRLFIFTTCSMLLKELRTYRTKTLPGGDTKIVKTEDDLVDPLRYMVLGVEQYADVPKRFKKKHIIQRFKPADKKVGY